MVIGDEDAPQDLMDNSPPPDGADFAIGDTIAVEWVRVKEPDDSEEMTINYANLSQLVHHREREGVQSTSRTELPRWQQVPTYISS